MLITESKFFRENFYSTRPAVAPLDYDISLFEVGMGIVHYWLGETEEPLYAVGKIMAPMPKSTQRGTFRGDFVVAYEDGNFNHKLPKATYGR